MKKLLSVVLFALSFFGFVASASAASVLDTATTTAITTGWTDLKDTVLALMTIAWPYMLSLIALMMAPRLVAKMFKIGAK